MVADTSPFVSNSTKLLTGTSAGAGWPDERHADCNTAPLLSKASQLSLFTSRRGCHIISPKATRTPARLRVYTPPVSFFAGPRSDSHARQVRSPYQRRAGQATERAG